MAQRTKARSVTFGRRGGDYVISNLRCEVPGDLRLTITHAGKAFEIATSFTGAHYSVAVGAAFSCAHQLGVPAAVIVERIASFTPVFGRCSVHRVENGPIFVNDATKAPHHSLGLAFDLMAGFRAPRKRIVLGQISDSSRSDKVYSQAYRAARSVVDQVIFVGKHSHRSKASAEDVAGGRFARFEKVADAADFLKQTAIPGELILLKGAHNLHLERLMLMFFTPVRCWIDACGKKSHCILQGKEGCGLYGVPFDQHNKARRDLALPLPDMNLGGSGRRSFAATG
jgi:UDP-N-acetylmuramoyl-tripeptide--D-alanyl-D-alanine ligase